MKAVEVESLQKRLCLEANHIDRAFTIAVLITAALVPATGTMAQGHAVRATLPFDGTIEVQNRDNHVAMLTTTLYNSHESRNSVFDKYSDQDFLSEILCRSSAMNVSVPASKQEKQARMQQPALRNASQVFVAAK